MLLPLALAILCAQESERPARIPEVDLAQPVLVTSADGVWGLDVVPLDRRGAGRARYRLFHRGAEVWERTHRFTLRDVLLLDDGTAFGHGYRALGTGHCAFAYDLHREGGTYPFGVVHPSGDAERLEVLSNIAVPSRLRHLRTGEERYLTLYTALDPTRREVPVLRAARLPAPADDLADLRARRTPRVVESVREVALESLGITPLEGRLPARHVVTKVVQRGGRARILVYDRSGNLQRVHDAEGRLVEEHRPGSATWSST